MKIVVLCTLLVIIMGILGVSSVSAGSHQFNSVVRGDDCYVAVGNAGLITKSSDTMNWTPVTSGVIHDLNSISWNGSDYIAVGSSGAILKSTDAETWSLQTSGVNEPLLGILWTGEFHVVIKLGNSALVSVDGKNWDQHLKSAPMLNDVIWSKAVNSPLNYGNVNVRLPDATVWESRPGEEGRQLSRVFWADTQLYVDSPPFSISKRTEKTLYQEWLDNLGWPFPNSGPLDDENGDGISNLLAYALDLSVVGDTANNELGGMQTLTPPINGGGVIYAFVRPSTERGDIRYIVEKSPTMGVNTWTEIAKRDPFGVWLGPASVEETINIDGRIIVHVTDVTSANETRYFFRTGVELVQSE